MRLGQALAELSRKRAHDRMLKSFSPAQFVTVTGGGANGQPIRPTFDAVKAIKEGIKGNPWIGAIVLMLVKYASSVPWVELQRATPKDKWEPTPDSDLSILLEYPNPKQSRKFLMGFQMQWLLASGNALFRYAKEGSVSELWPLMPTRTLPIPSSDLWISSYAYTSNSGGRKNIPADEVIHAMIPDPENPLWGMSPLQPLWEAIQTDNEAGTWNKNSLRSGGLASGIIQDENITDDQALAEFQQSVDKTFGGDGARRSKIAAMGHGTKYIPMSQNAVEMEWIEGRKFALIQFCAGLGTLPALLAPEAATYSNLKIAKAHVWTDGVLPLLDVFGDAFNTSLIGTDPKARRTRWLHYDTSGVAALRADLGEKIDMFVKCVQTGVPINEALEMLEIPADNIEGLGDEPMIQAGLIPLRNALDSGGDPRALLSGNL